MGFKVGRNDRISISDIKDTSVKKTKEEKLKKYDTNADGILDAQESARYYADKKSGYQPSSIDQVLKLAGGKQHELKTMHQEEGNVIWGSVANWKGDFNIAGVGAGNVRAERRPWETVDNTALLVDCNLMEMSFVEKIESATLMIGPRGMASEPGSTLPETVAVPLNIATLPGYETWNRGGGHYWVPERKYLAAGLDTADLRNLAGDSGGLSFYIVLRTNDGATHFVNKDGKPYNNFDFDAAELAPRDT